MASKLFNLRKYIINFGQEHCAILSAQTLEYKKCTIRTFETDNMRNVDVFNEDGEEVGKVRSAYLPEIIIINGSHFFLRDDLVFGYFEAVPVPFDDNFTPIEKKKP